MREWKAPLYGARWRSKQSAAISALSKPVSPEQLLANRARGALFVRKQGEPLQYWAPAQAFLCPPARKGCQKSCQTNGLRENSLDDVVDIVSIRLKYRLIWTIQGNNTYFLLFRMTPRRLKLDYRALRMVGRGSSQIETDVLVLADGRKVARDPRACYRLSVSSAPGRLRRRGLGFIAGRDIKCLFEFDRR